MKRLLFALLLTVSPSYAVELQLDHAFGPTLSRQALAFSPDAKRLAVVGSDGLKIYESATGKVLETRTGCRWVTSSVAWSPDGRTLAAGGLTFSEKQRGEICLWRQGQMTQRWATGDAAVEALAFSPDGGTLATASSGDLEGDVAPGSARLWNVADGRLRHSFGHYFANVAAIAFTADGRKVAYSTANGTTNKSATLLCDVHTGKVLKRWNGSAVPLLLQGASPVLHNVPLARRVKNGVELRVEEISGADHMRYRFVSRELNSRKPLVSQELGVGASCAAFGGDYLATTMIRNFFPGFESSVNIWKIEGPARRVRRVATLGSRTLMSMHLSHSSQDGNVVLVTNRGTALIRLKSSGSHIFHRFKPRDIFSGAAPSLSFNGRTLFDGLWIDLTDVKDGQLAWSSQLEEFAYGPAALSGDGFVLAGEPGLLHVVAARRREPPIPFVVPGVKGISGISRFHHLEWSPDSSRLALIGSVRNDNRLFLFNRSGRLEREIKACSTNSAFQAATFSPDGLRLLTARSNPFNEGKGLHLEIWNPDSGERIRDIVVPSDKLMEFGGGQVSSIEFSPQSHCVAVGGILFECGIWQPCILFFDSIYGVKIGNLPLPYREASFAGEREKSWTFLDEYRVAVLNNNAIEIWNIRSRKLEKSLFLVPKAGGIELVERPRPIL